VCSLAKDRYFLGVTGVYQALYRKYRPRTFDDVAGQAHITETLKNQVRTGRLSHAYLFIGTRGTGKTTCAKILARAVNCEHPRDGSPCNECRACRGIEDGSILDVVELDAASNNGVDNVRALRDEAVFSPVTVKKRVYIVDEVHMLSTPAFNALLKILEEPPEHLMFILATTELHKVPATILSRCQRHSFRRLDAETIARRLTEVAAREGIGLQPDAARLLGRLADGAMRDGLSLLDQCAGRERVDTEAVLSAVGLAGSLLTRQMLENVAAGRTEASLRLFQQLWQDGKEPATLLGELCSLLRDALMLQVAPKGGPELLSGAFDEKTLRGFRIPRGALLSAIDIIQATLGKMRDVRSPRMLAELCLIELCERMAVQAAPSPAELSNGSVRQPALPQETPVPSPFTESVPAGAAPAPSAEREIAPESGPEPEMISGPAAPQPASSPAAEVSWAAVLSDMQGQLPVGIYNLLSDESQVSGTFEGGKLVLRVNRGFAMGMLNTPELQAKLQACASGLAGAPVAVQFEESRQTKPADRKKLDELGRFSNVIFK